MMTAQAPRRANVISADEPAVAGDVGGQGRRKLAFDKCVTT